MTIVYFNGEEGRLEGRYNQSTNPEPQVALILHSEPNKGGSINDQIVDDMYKLFSENNFSVLKMNFRGVGRSSGTSTKEEGEMKDATIAVDWLHSKNMESKNFWVIGFSFGAWIAFQLAMRRPEIQEYILISPLPKKDLGFIVPCEAGGLIVQGEKDEVTTEEQTSKLVEQLSVKEGLNINYEIVENADHTFSEHKDKLREIVKDYINTRTIENMGRVIKIKRDRRRRRRKKSQEEDNIIVHIPAVKKIDFD
jgi:alpha/beta superfamily hydrolase